MTTPKLIIHGGEYHLTTGLREIQRGGAVPGADGAPSRWEARHLALLGIITESYGVLCAGDARGGVLHALRMLEDNPLFNAGTGSRIQADGKVRMSAALMDGPGNRFSAVINIQNVRYPSEVADRLAAERNRVLAGAEAEQWAREAGFGHHDPITPERWAEHESRRKGQTGTVGAVALDGSGRIWAGTSTGGIGNEIPGRVGDVPTVAGTYASARAGISCTGNGEEIVNQAMAAKVVTRVADGLTLREALDRSVAEADQWDYRFGLIGVTAEGEVAFGRTRGAGLIYAAHDGERPVTFFDEASEGEV